MPRFQLRDRIDFNTILQQLGVTDAFSDADLSGMTPAPLFVQQVQQSALIKVDEKGTEAAAVSGVSVLDAGPRTLTFDRPFLFLVRDTSTGAILFEAEVQNPAG